MSMIAITIQKIVKQAPEDLNLEDCNQEDIPKLSTKRMMPSFEPLTYIRALDLEVTFTPKFHEYPFLYTNTLRAVMTDGKFHVGR